jgi:hypothetical protein
VMSRLPLEKSRIEEVLRSHASGARNAYPLLWGVLMLLCFVAHHDLGFELPRIASRRAA